jgi:excisionase family DNA binding protein
MASRNVVSELATVAEVALELRVPASTVKTWLRTGRLPGMKLPNGQWRIQWSAVRALDASDHHGAARDRVMQP